MMGVGVSPLPISLPPVPSMEALAALFIGTNVSVPWPGIVGRAPVFFARSALAAHVIPVADQPVEGRFALLSLNGMVAHDLPGQHAVFRHVIMSARRDFCDAHNLSPDARGLLAGVSSSTVPFAHTRSCLANSAPGTFELHNSPMSYMSLSCYEEMSEEAFLIISSLQLGLPQRVLELPEWAHDASDARIDSTWADLALTNLAQSKGYHTVYGEPGLCPDDRVRCRRRRVRTSLRYRRRSGVGRMASGQMLVGDWSSGTPDWATTQW